MVCQVPSVEWVGKQLAPRLRERKLNTLYVATDGTDQEVKTLGENMPGVRIVRQTCKRCLTMLYNAMLYLTGA